MWRDTYDPACGNNTPFTGTPPENHVIVHMGYLEMHDKAWSPTAQVWRPIDSAQVCAGYPVKDFFAIARPQLANPTTPEALADYETVSRLVPKDCPVYRVIDRAKLLARSFEDMNSSLVQQLRSIVCIDRICDEQLINFAAVFAAREQQFGRHEI